MSFIRHVLCGHFEECSCSSGNRIPECRPVNEGLSEMFRQIGRTDTGREGECRKVVHARSEGGGEGRAGREGWKESEEVLREETHPLCCGGRNDCFALGRSCLRLLSGLETVTAAQRCGFTRYSSGSSSFLVLVSLPEILLEAH